MARDWPLAAMAIVLAATVALGTKDGLAKLMVADYPPVFLAWLQYSATYLLVAPLAVMRHGASALAPRPFGLQTLRGLFVMVTPLQFFIATRTVPLAEAHALMFAGPPLAVIWSALFLGERVRHHRWMAVICGFIGIWLVLRPNFSKAEIGHLFAFGAGVSLSAYFVLSRRIGSQTPALAGITHSVLFGTILLLPLVWLNWPAALSAQPGALAMFAVLAALGQALLILGFNFGPASFIAPFHFAIILTSIAFGIVVFRWIPDAMTLLGIGIVIASGVYIAVREARLGKIRDDTLP
jgi:drug/metabolite transporter (DMT)-like permease